MELLSQEKGEGCNHVIRVLEHGCNSKYHWTVMEFADRGELFGLIDSFGRLSVETATKYFRQICLGVNFLHENSICHLDLSLENILLTEKDGVKICDFGVAKKGRFFSSSKKNPGKLGFMCNEIFRHCSYDGQKADVWSAGVILWILIVGAPPYVTPASTDERFKTIMSGKSGISKLLSLWKITWFPTDAIDLLSHIFCPESSRYTMDQVLKHSFTTESEPAPSTTVSSSAASSTTTVSSTTVSSTTTTVTSSEGDSLSSEGDSLTSKGEKSLESKTRT
eukprot:TRINITY_DN49862_c0_g1_i1.p1 TRINITY_DN49862_c0_g1~~TRINITY_DN49862_c0_g1_i1.p1  ORF type:complete len:279 (+),score=19.68 TRINITY_DN49862_c0_g1_i1:183-1019(+)